MIVTRTRFVWPLFIAYICATGVGFVVGRAQGLPVAGAFMLGLLFDVGVLSVWKGLR